MAGRPAAIALVLLVAVVPAAGAAGTAPGAPGEVALWTEGDKDGFGTSTTRASKVWHTLDDGSPGFPPGEGTGSATPLAWTHAQFVRLAWSIDRGRPVERSSIVACRYQKECY